MHSHCAWPLVLCFFLIWAFTTWGQQQRCLVTHNGCLLLSALVAVRVNPFVIHVARLSILTRTHQRTHRSLWIVITSSSHRIAVIACLIKPLAHYHSTQKTRNGKTWFCGCYFWSSTESLNRFAYLVLVSRRRCFWFYTCLSFCTTHFGVEPKSHLDQSIFIYCDTVFASKYLPTIGSTFHHSLFQHMSHDHSDMKDTIWTIYTRTSVPSTSSFPLLCFRIFQFPLWHVRSYRSCPFSFFYPMLIIKS